MKKKGEVTHEDALCLLHAGGQNAPSSDRVELTRWVMQVCKEGDWQFTEWNEQLIPSLDSFSAIELLMEVEEVFHTNMDEVEIRAAVLETLGDVITFLEPRLVASPAFRKMVGERLKIPRAACPTQAAFYAVRRRLCDAGAAYSVVRALRSTTRLRRLSNTQAEQFVQGLDADYGLEIPLRKVVWGWMEVGPLAVLILFFIMLICVILSDYLPGRITSAILLWIVSTIYIGYRLLNCGRYKWPKEYQTLGDIARKIAESAGGTTTAAQQAS